MCYYIMISFEKLQNEELMIFAKLRNVDGQENMSRQQLESTFPRRPGPKLFARLDLRPKSLPQLQDLKNAFDDYKPKAIAGVFDNSYIEYKSEGVEDDSIGHYLRKISYTFAI